MNGPRGRRASAPHQREAQCAGAPLPAAGAHVKAQRQDARRATIESSLLTLTVQSCGGANGQKLTFDESQGGSHGRSRRQGGERQRLPARPSVAPMHRTRLRESSRAALNCSCALGSPERRRLGLAEGVWSVSSTGESAREALASVWRASSSLS